MDREPLTAEQIKTRSIQLEAINICNYRCPLCASSLKDWVVRREMTAEEVKRVIDPVAGDLREVVLYGRRGEPLLNKRIVEIVAYIKKAAGARISISTNGSLMDERKAAGLLEAGLDQIIFAIDGITQETYANYRVGGRLETVTANLQEFCRLKNKNNYPTRVILQFIPMAGNEQDIPFLADFGYNLGVDLVRMKYSSNVYKNKDFRTSSQEFSPVAPNTDRFECPSGIDKIYVDPNGYCYPCCYVEGEPDMLMGNAFETGLDKIWQSARMLDLRRSFLEQSGFNEYCIKRCFRVARARKIKLKKKKS